LPFEKGFGSQVQKEYLKMESITLGSPEEARVAQAEKWKLHAQRFLNKRSFPGDDDRSQRPKKLHRKKAYQWLLCLDSITTKVTGKSLSHWVPKDGQDPATWPYLSISGDQGSDGFSACHWLKYGYKANIEFLADPSHAVWNDVQLTWGQLKLTSFVRLMTIVYNLAHGPWQDGARFWQLKEATDEYFEVMSPGTCPLFQHLMPGLLVDFGLAHRQGEEDIEQLLWEEMKQHWSLRQKGTKVALCRFGNFVQAAADFDGAWNFMLLQILYYGMMTDMFDASTFRHLSQVQECAGSSSSSSSSAAKPDGRNAVPRGNDEVNKLRQLITSNLQLAALMLSDPGNQLKCKVMFSCSGPVRAWYSEQSHVLRSCAESKDWLCKQVAGAIHAPLKDTLAILAAMADLQAIGVEMTVRPHMLTLRPEHPKVQEDAALADFIGQWIMILCGCRVKRQLWMTAGWAGLQSQLYHESADRRQKVINKMKVQAAAFTAAKEQQHSFWKKAVLRSQFQTRPVEQLRHLIEQKGWEDCEEIRDMAGKRCSAVLQSKVSEDAFCQSRKQENKQANKIMAEKSAWKVLIDKQLASGVHRFSEPDWQSESVPAGHAGHLPRKLFHPAAADAPKAFRTIVSTSPRTSWYTCTPAGSPVIYADMVLMTCCHEHGIWMQVAEGHMLSQLARSPSLALAKATAGESKWYFSLGDVNGVCALGWPATVVKKSAGSSDIAYLLPDPKGKPTWLRIFDESTWVAVSFKWHGPLAQVHAGLDIDDLEHGMLPRLVAVPLSQARPLLEEAAHQCFFNLSAVTLNWLAKHLGLDLGGEKMCSKLEQLISHVLGPDLSEAELLAILYKRAQQPDLLQEMVELDAAEELVHASDRDDLEKEKVKAEGNASNLRDFESELRVRYKAFHSKIRKRCDISIMKNSAGQKYPNKFPAGEMNKEQAQGLCPPGWTVVLDRANGRWQGYRTGKSCSRSFLKHGWEGGCHELLKAMWHDYLLLQGLAGADCPLKGLFELAKPDRGQAGRAQG
jgi:hypothetical protein